MGAGECYFGNIQKKYVVYWLRDLGKRKKYEIYSYHEPYMYRTLLYEAPYSITEYITLMY